eukprot:992046-Lingulodinium_polyedra.AAC.1
MAARCVTPIVLRGLPMDAISWHKGSREHSAMAPRAAMEFFIQQFTDWRNLNGSVHGLGQVA